MTFTFYFHSSLIDVILAIYRLHLILQTRNPALISSKKKNRTPGIGHFLGNFTDNRNSLFTSTSILIENIQNLNPEFSYPSCFITKHLQRIFELLDFKCSHTGMTIDTNIHAFTGIRTQIHRYDSIVKNVVCAIYRPDLICVRLETTYSSRPRRKWNAGYLVNTLGTLQVTATICLLPFRF